jgi:hypothetical protein
MVLSAWRIMASAACTLGVVFEGAGPVALAHPANRNAAHRADTAMCRRLDVASDLI